MNHFVLPTDPHGEKSARYGDFAIDKLVDRYAASRLQER